MAKNTRDQLLQNLGATIGVLNDVSQTIVTAGEFSIEPRSIYHPRVRELSPDRNLVLFEDGLIYVPSGKAPTGSGRVIVSGMDRGPGFPALFLYTNPAGEPCTRCHGSGVEP